MKEELVIRYVLISQIDKEETNLGNINTDGILQNE